MIGKNWQSEGRCHTTTLGRSLEWVPDVEPATPQSLAPYRSVCAGCPVAALCLTEALTGRTSTGVGGGSHLEGVWAGTTTRMRRRMRKGSGLSILGTADATARMLGYTETVDARLRREELEVPA